MGIVTCFVILDYIILEITDNRTNFEANRSVLLQFTLYLLMAQHCLMVKYLQA